LGDTPAFLRGDRRPGRFAAVIGDRSEGSRVVLVELGLVEQRYEAVREVLDGAPVIEVARRYGVVRQTVHEWLRRYAADGGLANLADRSSRPLSCPHQIPAAVEARVVVLRVAHPAWGAARIRWQLEREGVAPLPGRSSVYRALVRHGLVAAERRKRRRSAYRRWERGRSMELWQMDVVGRIYLADGTELSAVTGLDDHSRFCVCARLVVRATARPVCDALAGAMRQHGVPEGILTDNGKVFTARFGRGPGPVLFDRICVENGVRHLLTAPYSPTTTGKVERFHKTLRAEWVRPNDRRFATIVEAQASLDAWVIEYNTARPHQSLGGRPPVERFTLAERALSVVGVEDGTEQGARTARSSARRPPGVSRWVDQRGLIRLAGFSYRVGPSFAGEHVEVVVADGVVEILHHGALVASHAQRLRADQLDRLDRRPERMPVARRVRDATSGITVTRIADSGGTISFAGTPYRAGRTWARHNIDVTIVAGSVQLSVDDKVIRVHPIRHDRSRELGAFANPNGRPRKTSRAETG
jgi:transposase InsO family protein